MARLVLLSILLFSQLVLATGGTSVKQIDTMAATGGTAITVPSTGVWTVATGGTGSSTALTQYGVKYAASTTAEATTAAGTAGYPLVANSSAAPTFQQLGLTTGVTGTLPVGNGGTGTSTAPTQWGVVYAATTSGYASTAAGTSGYLLTSNASSAPTYQQINLGTSAAVTGTLGATHGGTGLTSNTTAPTATTFTSWDANKNLTANNYISSYTTTATAAGTTTLLVGSTYQQFFTGTTTQTVALPVATTLVNGQSFLIVNNSTGVVTVQTSGATSIQAMAANSQLLVTCINTAGGTGLSSWSWTYTPVLYGALSISAGGTNNSSLSVANGGLIYTDGTKFQNVGAGTSGQFLKSNGAAAPTWTTANLGTPIEETPSGSSNGSNVTFTLTYTPTSSGIVLVHQNGLLLVQGVDYTISSATITMTTAPALGQNIYVSYSH